ncbi:MAG TPA: CDP-glycerol glycerophosphotransferase family protein [Longimicrobiaceae bacterium]
MGRKALAHARARAIRAAFDLFSLVTPVRSDFWCFCTWEGYAHTLDNPRALFEEVKNDSRIRKIILQKSKSPPSTVEGTRVTFVAAESLYGAYLLARSKVLVTGYALRGVSSYSSRIRPGRHDLIQLWHGIPLKRIGRLFPHETWWEKETPHYSAIVCSSERDREIMAQAFAPIPMDRVWLTGLPRNSLILKEESALPADYRSALAHLDSLLDGRRLVIYAPTWRERPESLYSFSEEEQDVLACLLRRHNAVLGVRGHANVRHRSVYRDMRESEAIISLNEFADVNVILRRGHVLVTDYSSIYIDFLLLDRPIIHFAYDLEAYVRERGFLYDLDDAFGGACCTTFDHLLTELERALVDSDHCRERRLKARRLFHTHSTDAAAAVRDRLFGLLDSPSPKATA